MPEIAEYYVELSARSAEFVAGMEEADVAADEADGSIASVGKTAIVAGLAIAGGLAAGAAGAVDLATKFQQQLTLVRTQAHDTTDNLQVLGNQLLALAGQVGQSPTELAQAYYHLASAGYSGAQALDILTESAKLADVGQSDLETTTQAVLFTLKSGIPGVLDAADAVAQLNAIVGQGDMRMDQLTSAMGSGLLPTAATFGVSLRSVGAALDYMADRGVAPVEAATRLKMSLSMIAAPTKAAATMLEAAGVGAKDAGVQISAMQKTLEAAGVTQTRLAADLRQPDGIVVALQDLKTSMTNAGVSASEQGALLDRAFGGARTGTTLMMLWNNLDGVTQKFEQLGKASTAANFQADWEAQSKQFGQVMKNDESAAQAFAIQIGDMLLPAASKLGVMFSTDVMPELSKVAAWIEQDGIPDLQELARWFDANLLPPIESAIGSVEGFGAVLEHLGAGIVGVGESFGGPMLEGLKWITANGWVVDEVMGLWVERLLVIKGLQIGQEVGQFVSAFRTFQALGAEGVAGAGTANALKNALGLGGSNGITGQMEAMRKAFSLNLNLTDDEISAQTKLAGSSDTTTVATTALTDAIMSQTSAIERWLELMTPVQESDTAIVDGNGRVISSFGALGLAAEETAGKVAAAQEEMQAGSLGGVSVAPGAGVGGLSEIEDAAPALEETGEAASGASLAIGGMMGPIGLLGVGLAVATPLIVSHWSAISKAIEDPASKLQDLQNQWTSTLNNITTAQANASKNLQSSLAQQGTQGEFAQGFFGSPNLGLVPQQLTAMVDAYQTAQTKLAAAHKQFTTDWNTYQQQEAAGQSGTDASNASEVDTTNIANLTNELGKLQINPAVLSSWGSLSDESKNVITQLATAGDRSGINQFYTQLVKDNGNAVKALSDLGAADKGTFAAMIADLGGTAEATIDQNESIKQSWQTVHDEVYENAIAMGDTKKAADALADSMANSQVPAIDGVNKSMDGYAKLLHTSTTALQALIQTKGPSYVAGLIAEQQLYNANAAAAAAEAAAVKKLAGQMGISTTAVLANMAAWQQLLKLLATPAAKGALDSGAGAIVQGSAGHRILGSEAAAVTPSVAVGGGMGDNVAGGDTVFTGDITIQAADLDDFVKKARTKALQRAKSGGRRSQYGKYA